jgi:hypothetical protein
MREEKMKKYFVFLCCLLFAVLFISCSKSKDGNSGSSASRIPVAISNEGNSSSNSPQNPGNPQSIPGTPTPSTSTNMFVDLKNGSVIAVEVTNLENDKYRLVFKLDGTSEVVKIDMAGAQYTTDDMKSKAKQLGTIKEGYNNMYQMYISAVCDVSNNLFLCFFCGTDINCVDTNNKNSKNYMGDISINTFTSCKTKLFII